MRLIHSGYLHKILDADCLKREVSAAIEILRSVNFDAIAVIGSSGTIFGGALSYATGKPLILVRKENDASHSNFQAEGDPVLRTYLFVDDTVATGASRSKVKWSIRHEFPHMEYVGTYTYQGRVLMLEKDAWQTRRALAELFPELAPSKRWVEAYYSGLVTADEFGWSRIVEADCLSSKWPIATTRGSLAR
jgi:hypothetical protein